MATHQPNSVPTPDCEIASGKKRVRNRLYTSHVLSTLGDRVWQFCIGLVLFDLNPTSLRLAALYGLSQSVVIIFLGAECGRFTDNTDHLKAVRIALFTNNLCVFVTATILALMLLFPLDPSSWEFNALIGVVMTLSAILSLASVMSDLCVERRWSNVLAEGDTQALAEINARMRSIDLMCKTFGPVAAGFTLTIFGSFVSCVVLATYHLLTLAPSYLLLRGIYIKSPGLQVHPAAHTNTNSEKEKGECENEPLLGNQESRGQPLGWWSRWKNVPAVYLHHPAAMAGISFSFLYLTFLSFGSVTTVYLKWCGVSEFMISIVRSSGAVMGLSATMTYPRLRKKMSLTGVGCIGMWCLVAPLSLCFLSLMVYNKVLAVGLLMAGMALSRFGLWTTDLSVFQQLQEYGDPHTLSLVNGVQSSLNNVFMVVVTLVRRK
eukprot:CFRG8558T1